jgi:hypothetical protein
VLYFVYGLFPMQVTNDEQSITSTRGSLDRQEADFLARVGPAGVFPLKQAQRILGEGWENYVRRYIARLRLKGWIERIKQGLYVVVPLSSGTERTPRSTSIWLPCDSWSRLPLPSSPPWLPWTHRAASARGLRRYEPPGFGCETRIPWACLPDHLPLVLSALSETLQPENQIRGRVSAPP